MVGERPTPSERQPNKAVTVQHSAVSTPPPVQDKRRKGPLEAADRTLPPAEVLAQLLASFATDLRNDPAWKAIVKKVPRQTRRELGRRFGQFVVGLREEA